MTLFKLSVAINWMMSEMDPNKTKAPYIQNLNLGRKGKQKIND